MEDNGGVGGPKALSVPQIQFDNFEIILNTPEMDLKTGKTNHTTKCREEATLKKLGSVAMGLGEKWIMALLEVGSMVVAKGERQISTQRSTKRKGIPEQMTWKARGACLSSCNQWELKFGVLKVSILGSRIAWRALRLLLEKRPANSPETYSMKTVM